MASQTLPKPSQKPPETVLKRFKVGAGRHAKKLSIFETPFLAFFLIWGPPWESQSMIFLLWQTHFFAVLVSSAAERPSGRQHAPKVASNRLKIHPKSIQNLLKCYHRTLENNRCTLPKFMHKIQATTLGNPTRRAKPP